jgi:hypothetical protein
MLCRACEEAVAETAEPQAQPKPERRRRTSDQLCDRCGHLLGADELQQQAAKKRSELAKFGLDGPAPPLLKPNERN